MPESPRPLFTRSKKPDQQKPLWIDRQLATHSLKGMAKALRTFPRGDHLQQVNVEDYNLCSRSRRFDELGFAALLDGVAVIYTTKATFEYRSHRFIFPDEGEPLYHREPFFVDCQVMPSERLNLDGTLAIVSNPDAIVQIQRFGPAIMSCAKEKWAGLHQGSFRASSC